MRASFCARAHDRSRSSSAASRAATRFRSAVSAAASARRSTARAARAASAVRASCSKELVSWPRLGAEAAYLPQFVDEADRHRLLEWRAFCSETLQLPLLFKMKVASVDLTVILIS